MKNCRAERCPRRARCKRCNAARTRQARKTLAKYHERRATIVQMLGGKCVECDATTGLEIDHVDQTEKKFYVSRCMTIALPKLHEEIRKCRLLCVDHHKKTPSYGRSRKRAEIVAVVEIETEIYVSHQDIEF